MAGAYEGLESVLVVGCGLIGTSAALALRGAGRTVWLADTDPGALEAATARGAGAPWVEGGSGVQHVLLAVPPGHVGRALLRWQSTVPEATFSDTASVKTRPLHDAQRLGADLRSFVGGHPMAGREQGGAAGADAALFAGRVWALCPTVETSTEALVVAQALLRLCGARGLVMDPLRHDMAVAAVSHLPQLVASALAAVVGELDDAGLSLASTGLTDTTRLADSDAELWTAILQGNAAMVRPRLRRLREVLATLEHSLGDPAEGLLDGQRPVAGGAVGDGPRRLLLAGREARARFPTKGARGAWDRVLVVVPDEPGALAALLLAVSATGTNVEDLHVEHLPDRHGEVALEVAAVQAADLVEQLRAAGWSVRGS